MEKGRDLNRITAILIAGQLDLRGIKQSFDLKPLVDTSTELLLSTGSNRYHFFFNYGVVVFANYSDEEIKLTIKSITPFLKNPVQGWIREEFIVEVNHEANLEFEFDRFNVNRLDDKVFRITMLNLAQSVALDHYNHISEGLLFEVKGFTRELEARGKLSLRRTSMMKFIGKALSTKNEITDNVYIFDAPEMVWDDEYLDKLNQGLKKHFDLRIRFSEIEYTLRTISENLDIFREIYNQRENSLLEWIIIILILVEVFDMLISRIF